MTAVNLKFPQMEGNMQRLEAYIVMEVHAHVGNGIGHGLYSNTFILSLASSNAGVHGWLSIVYIFSSAGQQAIY